MAWPENVTRVDLQITFYKGSGAGGQKRNKTSSAVRIKHLPTGIVAECEEERQQSLNKKIAFRKLAEKLVPIMKRESQKQRNLAGEETVRTYHQPDQRVTDKRVTGEQWTYDGVIDGDDLGDIIQEVIKADSAR